MISGKYNYQKKKWAVGSGRTEIYFESRKGPERVSVLLINKR